MTPASRWCHVAPRRRPTCNEKATTSGRSDRIGSCPGEPISARLSRNAAMTSLAVASSSIVWSTLSDGSPRSSVRHRRVTRAMSSPPPASMGGQPRLWAGAQRLSGSVAMRASACASAEAVSCAVSASRSPAAIARWVSVNTAASSPRCDSRYSASAAWKTSCGDRRSSSASRRSGPWSLSKIRTGLVRTAIRHIVTELPSAGKARPDVERERQHACFSLAGS